MSQASVLYLIGFLVAVIGLAWAAHLAGMPSQWIGASVVVLVGIGIAAAAKRFGGRPPSSPPR
jgi:O-antigen/teichoic acid export membrane protein